MIVPKRLTGNKDQKLSQINEICKSRRPIGNIVGIVKSQIREKEQMCLIRQIDATGNRQGRKKLLKEMILAAPVNQKLPWMEISNDLPESFTTEGP